MMNKIIHWDCLEVMKSFNENSIDTIITDPPYWLEFMGKEWDKFKKWNIITNPQGSFESKKWFKKMVRMPTDKITLNAFQEFSYNWLIEAKRVIKPWWTLLIFWWTRTYHRVACAVEDAWLILKDCIMWLYGSWFPKAYDIAKGIEGKKTFWSANRKDWNKLDGDLVDSKIGYSKLQNKQGYRNKDYSDKKHNENIKLYHPEAQKRNWWKSHWLKPWYEPIIWAHKPLELSKDLNIIGSYFNYLIISICLLIVKLEKIDMFKYYEMVWILLNTVSLWNNVYEESLKQENMYTILTETELITELKILKSLILVIIPENTIHEEIIQHGVKLIAKVAENYFGEEKKNMKDIQNVIAQESVILKRNKSFMNAINVDVNLLPQIQNNLNTVLLNVITILGKKITPNYEPILVCHKPNNWTYAENALKWWVSWLWIDWGRIKTKEELWRNNNSWPFPPEKWWNNNSMRWLDTRWKVNKWRFPSNVILDEEATNEEWKRYFYCAKASKSERNAWCEWLEIRQTTGWGWWIWNYLNDVNSCSWKYWSEKALSKNHHPTVKPLKLMEYLCKLTKTPTWWIVLDPFAWSWTTWLACIKTNRDYILIEKEKEYIDIIHKRLWQSIQQALF